jgi:hypothetical protein
MILPIRSMPCCEPLVITKSSGVIFAPRRAMTSQMLSRTGTIPSVTLYCNEVRGCFSNVSRVASFIPSVSNNSGAGNPPANEMMSGCAVTFKISRTKLGLALTMRSAIG